MEVLIKIGLGEGKKVAPSLRSLDPALVAEITNVVQQAGGKIYHQTPKDQPPRTRGLIPITEIIVALGSAGAFTTVYQVIREFLEKNKDREIVIEREGVKLTIKGHSLPDERELLEKLLP